jgi:tetratricopeptide (TPR) repeat protein
MILDGMDKEFQDFRKRVVQIGRSIDEASGIGRTVLKGITGRLAIKRERQELHRNLDLASRELEAAAKVDADACLEIEGDREISYQGLLATLERARGDVEFTSGNVAGAIRHYEDSVSKYEHGETYYILGLAYEAAVQPGKALQAFDKANKLQPDDETGVEALKNAERLKSKMIMGGWFVGSWKVVLILGGLAALGLFIIGRDPASGITWVVLWGGILALYWWRKWRK